MKLGRPSRADCWVLVCDDGFGFSQPSLSAVRALAAGGYQVGITVCGDYSVAAASRYCARRIEVPRAGTKGYVEKVQAEVQRGRYVCALPASDAAVMVLVQTTRDYLSRASLTKATEAVGLKAPPVFSTPADLLSVGEELPYPVVVSRIARFPPRRRADSPADLAWWRDRGGPLLVQPYVNDELRGVSGVVWRGELVAPVHQRYLRTWPSDCGTACAAETIGHDRELEGKLLGLLSGYEGIFQADIAGPYLLDLNLRVYDSLPLAVAAGANLPAIYCDLLRGKSVESVRARPGVFYRWLDGDVRSVLWSLRRRRLTRRQALEALWPSRGTVHGPESLKDPGPMLARAKHARVRERKVNRKKEAG